MFRLFWKILLGILAVPIAAIALVVGSWLITPDESLDAETARVLAYRPVVPAAENLFVALWGFNASPELDPFEAGSKIVAAHAQHPRAQDAAAFSPGAFWGATPLKVPSAPRRACRPDSKGCLTELLEDESTLDARVREYAPYVQRYRTLRGYPRFAEVIQTLNDAPMLPWSGVTHASDLVDAEIARDLAVEARRSAALRELAEEVALWRRIGMDADTLITKMVATAVLSRKYRLTSDLLAAYPAIAWTHAETVALITAPLPAEWAHMKRVMDGEFRFTANSLPTYRNVLGEENLSDGWASMLMSLNAFRVNATLNAHRRLTSRIGEFYSQPARAIAERNAAFQREAEEFDVWSPRVIFYNPVGKIIVNISQPLWGDYAFRIHDMVGYSRLIELQRRLTLARASDGEIGPSIGADPALFDPYTDKPMDWIPETRELRFAARGSKLKAAGIAVKVLRPDAR